MQHQMQPKREREREGCMDEYSALRCTHPDLQFTLSSWRENKLPPNTEVEAQRPGTGVRLPLWSYSRKFRVRQV
jgi:hypothetical protein